jgi:hypothetical protein
MLLIRGASLRVGGVGVDDLVCRTVFSIGYTYCADS